MNMGKRMAYKSGESLGRERINKQTGLLINPFQSQGFARLAGHLFAPIHSLAICCEAASGEIAFPFENERNFTREEGSPERDRK